MMTEINSDIKNVIESNPVAVATVNPNNTPNVIGVAYVKIVSNNQVLITDNFMNQTMNNIKNNNNICLAAWNKDWDGYKLAGTAEYFSEGEWKTYVEQMPENKGLSAKGAILVTISQITQLG